MFGGGSKEAEGPGSVAQDLGGGRGALGWAPDLRSPAEGLKKLFSGASMASSRGLLVTVGQVGLLLVGGLSGQHLGDPPSAPGEVVEEGRGLGPHPGAGEVGRPLPVGPPPSAWSQ